MAFTFKKTIENISVSATSQIRVPATIFHNIMSQIGNSLFDAPGSEKVAALLEKAKKNNVKVVFPVDYITADKFDKDANVRFTGVILWAFFCSNTVS